MYDRVRYLFPLLVSACSRLASPCTTHLRPRDLVLTFLAKGHRSAQGLLYVRENVPALQRRTHPSMSQLQTRVLLPSRSKLHRIEGMDFATLYLIITYG